MGWKWTIVWLAGCNPCAMGERNGPGSPSGSIFSGGSVLRLQRFAGGLLGLRWDC